MNYHRNLYEQITNTHFLTREQLKKACDNNKYILARFLSGYQMGINCGVSNIALKRHDYDMEGKTPFISYISCGFMEYISKKHIIKNDTL